MNLDPLRLLAETARAGGFAPVARARGVDPSSVSRAVAALETELGVRLLERNTRRMALTEAGAAFLRRVEPALHELDHAADAARATARGVSGTLRLTASVAYGTARLVPLVPLLRAAHPALALDLVLTDATLDLVAERIDLALRLGVSILGEGIAAKLAPTRYRVVASPAYLALAGVPSEPSELANRRCLLFELPEFRTRWRFRRMGVISDVAVDGDIVATSALALRDLAVAGCGPALLADWLVAGELATGSLVDLFPSHDAAASSFETAAWLLYPSRVFLPAKTRVTVDFLRAHLGGPPDDGRHENVQ